MRGTPSRRGLRGQVQGGSTSRKQLVAVGGTGFHTVVTFLRGAVDDRTGLGTGKITHIDRSGIQTLQGSSGQTSRGRCRRRLHRRGVVNAKRTHTSYSSMGVQ